MGHSKTDSVVYLDPSLNTSNLGDAIIRLAEKAAKDPRDVPNNVHAAELDILAKHAETSLMSAYQIAEKGKRHDAIDAIKSDAEGALVGEEAGKIPEKLFGKLFKELESRVMRSSVLETGRRIDGRETRDQAKGKQGENGEGFLHMGNGLRSRTLAKKVRRKKDELKEDQ